MVFLQKQRLKKELTQYVDSMFGTYNNIVPAKNEFREEINFTNETLSYMTVNVHSKRIVQQIRDVLADLESTLNRKLFPYNVIESCGGIGGNSLAFAESTDVNKVVAYEIDPKRANMLKNNAALYKLEHKIRVKTKPFPTSALDESDTDNFPVVLYIDPPWLPHNIRGDESNKKQYILSGIKIGKITLESIVSKYIQHVSLIVIRAPSDYQIRPINCVKIRYQDCLRINKKTKKKTKKYRLYFFTLKN